MAISKVVVVDGNNLIVRIDRGVAGRGVTDVEPVVIDGSLYLVFTFSDGTTETVGPVGTIQYVGTSPIVVSGSTISLTTVPVNLGGTGQVTANAGFNALAPTQTGNSGKYLKTDGTNSAWDLLDISTADITGVLPLANGGTASSTASGARTNLGLGTIATQNASSVAITGGTITGITDLAVADGGTGASTAAGARTNLNAVDQALTLTAGTGLSGGGDLTANRSFSITNTGVTAAAYGAASKTLTATVNAQGQLTVLADTPIAIANTQISGLGTMSTQNANAVAITGGSITGITDLAVADGGTGASDAAGARTNLNAANQATIITAGTGLSGGGDLSANRTINIANTTVTAGAFGSASNTLTATVNAQGQLTALAATPIAIANTQVSGLGTMSTQNSNAVTITGGSITGITDLAIADGGTGASNAADARSNLGLGSAAVLNAGVALGVATLDAGGTVPLSQIPASIQGGVSYQGAWNASTNTPTLVSSVGSKGYYYVVSVAGNTNLNGVTDWLVGDWAIFNGSVWQKIDNTDQVASVNGYTGVVVLSNIDVGAPPTSLTISAGTGLSGGGSLAANRTLSIANTTVTAAPYGTASAVPTFTVNGQGQLTAASNVTIAIANTQVSGLGTMSTQNANSVAITGGSITGITDLAIADGGTGASTAADARTNLSAAYNAITISAGTGLTGGGDLTANRTLAIDSSVVTLTGTQTLTNKTLTSPLVNEILDTNGNEILGLSPTTSATDFLTVKNGIGVGVPLHVYADGSSASIGLHIQPKGSGLVTISDGTDFNKGIRFRSSGSAASAVTLLDAVATAGRVVTLPDATTTLVGRDTTDTLTNKTIAFGSNTFSGSLAIANGGTGQATANAAFNALAPSQTGNSGKYLTTNGTDTSWASNPLGTVTSVAASVPSFLSIAGSPITTSGTLAISLSGTALPTTSGGTGLTSFTSGGVVYASSSSALATGSALTFDGNNLSTTGFVGIGEFAASSTTGLNVRFIGSLTSADITGVGSSISAPATASSTTKNYYSSIRTTATSGSRGYLYNFYAEAPSIGATSTAVISHGLYVSNQGNAAITNAYGVYIEPQSGSPTVNYGLFNGGTSRLDGNVGVAVASSDWASFKAIDVNIGGAALTSSQENCYLTTNAYFNSGWKYKFTTVYGVSWYEQFNGQHAWFRGSAGTAGTAIASTQGMTLFSDGNLTIGDTNSGARLRVVNGNSPISTMLSTNGNGGYQEFSNGSTIPLYIGFGPTLVTGLSTSDAALRYSNNLVFSYVATEVGRFNSSGLSVTGTVTAGASKTISLYDGNLRQTGSATPLYIGTASTGFIQFYNNDANTMQISAAGNVGIGTNYPDLFLSGTTKLVVYANVNSQHTALVRNDNAGSSASSAIALNAYGNTWGIEIGSAAKNGNALTFQLDYNGANAEKMRLTTNAQLVVGSNSAISGLTSGAIQVGSGPFAGLVTTGSGDTTRIITDGAIEFNYDGVSGTQRHGKIRGTGNSTGGGYAGGLAFEYYSFNGSAYQWYTGAELDSVGNFSINSPSGTKYVQLQPDGSVRSVLASGSGGDSIFSAITGVSNGYQISVTTGNAQTYKWFNGGSQSMTLGSSGKLNLGGTGTPSNHMMAIRSTTEAGVICNGAQDIGNDASITVDVNNATMLMISENNTGDGGLFFCGYASATITLISDPNNKYATSITAGKVCVTKSAASGTVTITNKVGSTRSITVGKFSTSD